MMNEKDWKLYLKIDGKIAQFLSSNTGTERHENWTLSSGNLNVSGYWKKTTRIPFEDWSQMTNYEIKRLFNDPKKTDKQWIGGETNDL